MNNGQRQQNAPMPNLRPGRGAGPRINKEKPKNMGKTVRRLLGYIGKSKLLVIALILIMVTVTVADTTSATEAETTAKPTSGADSFFNDVTFAW